MKLIKKVVKAFVVAFSIYSKIPMPRFTWESEDMKYHLCFFPWVGAFIGVTEWLWYWFASGRGINTLAFVLFALAIPVIITGGFHLDGFMDTCDALHSYQDKEKKLEILKDPHIGAFAVICFALYFLLAGGSISLIYEAALKDGFEYYKYGTKVFMICASFYISRALSGFSVVTLPGAKAKGMLQTFSDTAGKRMVRIVLIMQVVIAAIGMLILSPLTASVALAADAISFGYYVSMSKKQFGGITGDLAGYFVSLTELLTVAAMAVMVLAGG